MQDGAPGHRANLNIQFLNNRFPNGWIGIGETWNWPPYSPYLTPMDFFLWGFVKDHVYAATPERQNTAEGLRELITEGFWVSNVLINFQLRSGKI